MTDQAVDVPRDPMQEFQKKITDRMREDIGSLLPQEVLDEMCRTSLQKLFFEERPDHERSDNWNKRTKPSWFQEEIQNRLGSLAEAEVETWLNNNAEFLRQQVTAAVTEKLPELIVGRITEAIIGGSAAVIDATVVDALMSKLHQQNF